MSAIKPTRFDEGARLLIAGLKEHYTPATMSRIPEQWERLRPYLGNVPNQLDKKSYGVCYNLDQGEFDYLCGVKVSSISQLPEGFSHIETPPQRYAVFTHDEHISKLKDTLDAIGKEWLPNAEYEPTGYPAFFERYENYNPETGMGDIEIWVPVKKG